MTIKQQQCLLEYLGYSPGAIDGQYGEQTKQAIMRFQQDYSLEPDGICGAMTEKMLLGVVSGTVAKKETVAPTNTKTNTTVQDAVQVPSGTWWDDIKHFRPDEENITCPCWRCRGKKEYPEERLMREADHIRDIAKKAMVPSSVRRCQEHNDELPGSAKNSYHVRGLAMDFDIPALADSKIKEILEAEKAAGRVRYWYQMDSGWFHFDVN